MDIDPRLRPGDENVKENKNIPFSSRDALFNPRHNIPSYSTQASNTSTRLDHGTSYGHISPESSNDQLQGSTPSSTGNNGLSLDGPLGAYLNEMSMGNDEHDSNDPLADLKRPRACEACRQLKVRCEPDNENPSGSCKRCAKAKRQCIVTAPTRKRQKKTDSRVSELEKKIDALTATLQASKRGDAPGQEQEALAPRRWLGGGRPPPTSMSPTLGTKRTFSGDTKPGPVSQTTFTGSSGRLNQSSSVLQNSSGDQSQSDNVMNSANEFIDIIDRGLVDVQTATEIFDRYVNDVAPKLPVVIFPKGTTMASVRRDKPILFLVIMAISIGYVRPELQLPLVNEVHRLFADRVVVKGEKSLELVQSIILACIWYTPPNQFEELKFFQFIYMAITMSLDIGMGRVTRRQGNKPVGLLREIMGKNQHRATFDPDAPETRRVWLGAYFMAVNASMALRRPLLCRWHPYMDECLEILENSPDAQPSDRNLIHWAKLTHLAEDIGFQFSMDDPSSNLTMSDSKAQYSLKGFEKQLDEWRKDIPPDEYTPVLEHLECVVNIYMHEIAMHNDHNIDDFRTPFTSDFKTDVKFEKATAAQIDALTTCLTSIHRSIDCLTAIEPELLVTIPTHLYARTAYAFIALLKLFSAVCSDNGLGRVFSPADLKVEEYFDKMINHFKVTSHIPGGRTASRFCMVLNLLRNWFANRQTEQSGGSLGEITSVRPQKPSDNEKRSSMSATAAPARQHAKLPDANPPYKEMGPPTSTASNPQQWAQYSVSSSEPTPSNIFIPQQYPFAQGSGQEAGNSTMTGLLPGPQPVYGDMQPDFDFQMPFDAEGIFSMDGILPDEIFDLPFNQNGNIYSL